MATQGEIYDALSSFPKGINSGIDATLLGKDQVAYATNATFRGTFIGPRPEFVKRELVFASSAAQTNFETGLFQGACFYQPDAGNAQIVVSIAGRLFAIDLITLTVTDVSITNNLNPSTITQAWLWQTERWVIVQDGISAPIIYDGVVSRRAVGLVPYGVINGNALIPASGVAAPANVVSPGYTGPLGASVLIATSLGTQEIFTVAASASAFSITLTSLNDSIGTNYPVGTQFINDPNKAGVLSAVTFVSSAPGGFSGSTIYTYDFTFSSYTGGVGSKFKIGTQTWQVTAVSANVARATFSATPTAIALPAVITYAGATQPTSVAFTLTDPFPSIASGSSAGVTLGAPYTGTNGATVWVGTKAYTVTAVSSSSSPTVINLINNNGADLTVANGATIYSVPELPAGRMGCYGMGRNWTSLPNAISYVAGDIVGGPSGSPNYDYRDAVLKMVENTFLSSGGSFSIPVSGDQITAIRFMANLDASLGQGPLQVFTQGGAFTCNAPVDRDTWSTLTNPIQSQSLIANGSMSQNATILDNSDIDFRSPDGVRSFLLARRDFNSPGNVPFSREITRLISGDDLSLLAFASAVNFDNRILMTARPVQGDNGVYHTALAVKNNDPLSTINDKLPAIWEGEWTGLNCFQLILARVLLVDRAYAFHKNLTTGATELYEILTSDASRDGKVEWGFESPSLFQFDPKNRRFQKLTNGEMWVDSVSGALTFKVYYRADDSAEWILWRQWSEDANTGTFKPRMGLGQPENVPCDGDIDRPADQGYMFFVKKVFTGKFRYKGSRYLSTPQPEPKFKQPKCQ